MLVHGREITSLELQILGRSEALAREVSLEGQSAHDSETGRRINKDGYGIAEVFISRWLFPRTRNRRKYARVVLSDWPMDHAPC